MRDLELDDIDNYLFRARYFRGGGAAPATSGLQVNLFFEASTRTRMSFEVAGRRLGLTVANLETGSSSLSKGESLEDTVRSIDAMGPDILVVRHGRAGVPDAISEWTSASVVNAGDGAREHPTQALLDCLTLCDRFGLERAAQLGGLTIAVIGDVAHSRVARSNLALWSKAGVSVRLVGPRAFVPRGFAELGWEVHHTLAPGIRGVDAIYALRVQTERQHGAIYPSLGEYFRQYGLTRERLDRHAPNAAVLHPGPVNRGVDLSAGLVRDARSLVDQQVANGVWVRMAVLDQLCELRRGV